MLAIRPGKKLFSQNKRAGLLRDKLAGESLDGKRLPSVPKQK